MSGPLGGIFFYLSIYLYSTHTVHMPRTWESQYCSETVDICTWRRTLRWCCGTTSGWHLVDGWKLLLCSVSCKQQLMAWLAIQHSNSQMISWKDRVFCTGEEIDLEDWIQMTYVSTGTLNAHDATQLNSTQLSRPSTNINLISKPICT